MPFGAAERRERTSVGFLGNGSLVTHWNVVPARNPLFDADLPDGFRYRRDFITNDDEAFLTQAIERVEFSTFEMRGVVARRRVAFFGRSHEHHIPAVTSLRYSITFRTVRA